MTKTAKYNYRKFQAQVPEQEMKIIESCRLKLSEEKAKFLKRDEGIERISDREVLIYLANAYLENAHTHARH